MMQRITTRRRWWASALLAAAALTLVPAWPASGSAHRTGTTWLINTIAGGIGGPGPASQIASGANCAVAFSGGHLYATEGFYVRRISLRTGLMDTPVGSLEARFMPDGLPAADTALDYTCGLAFDAHGNLLMADSNEIVVDPATNGTFYGQAMTAGHVYSIAGSSRNETGYSGDGGPAGLALLNSAAGMAVDGAGNVIVADTTNDVVRLVAAQTGSFYGQAMTAGDIYTIAGDGFLGNTGVGGLATAAEINLMSTLDGGPPGTDPWPVIAADSHGSVLLGDVNNGLVKVVAGSTGTFYGQAMTVGHIYALAAQFGRISGLTLDHSGNILVSDVAKLQVKVIAVANGTFYGQHMRAGQVHAIAGNTRLGSSGDGGPALKASFSGPVGLTADSAGNVVIGDHRGYGDFNGHSNELLRVLANHTGTYYGIAMKAGDLYTISGRRGLRFYGDGVPATAAVLAGGATLTTDLAGGILIFDNDRIRMMPGRSGTFFRRRMVTGDIYTIAGTGRAGYAGDRGLATRARLGSGAGLAVDRSGNVIVADPHNNSVRVIAAKTGRLYGRAMKDGDIYTIAGTRRRGLSGDRGPAGTATLDHPFGVAVDHSGNILVTDQVNRHRRHEGYPFDTRVRVIAGRTGTFYRKHMKAGDIYTLASVSGVSVVVDASGNLVLADRQFVHVVAEKAGTFYGMRMTPGVIYTVAGDRLDVGPVTDGIPATSAWLVITGMSLDPAGNVVLASNFRIRLVAVRTGTYYGQAMIAGHIYTIGGGHDGVPLGDGGPAVAANIGEPTGMAVTPAGAIVFDEEGLIRRISS